MSNIVLLPGEPERVYFAVAAFRASVVFLYFLYDGGDPSGGKHIPCLGGVVEQIVIIVRAYLSVLGGDLYWEKPYNKIHRLKQVGIELGVDGVVGFSKIHVHTHHGGQ